MIYQLGVIRYDDTFMVQMRRLDDDGQPTDHVIEERELEVAGTLCVSASSQLCIYVDKKAHGSGRNRNKSNDKAEE